MSSGVPNHFLRSAASFRRADGGHAFLDDLQRGQIALAGGPPELPLVELEGLAEVVLGVGPVEIEVGRKLVEAEQLDLLTLGGGDQCGVVGVFDQRGDVLGVEPVDAGIARLHADLEALEGAHAADAADGGVGVDRHRQIGVRLGELVERLALGRAVDHVDHVGPAVGDHPLGLGPVGGGEVDLDAGAGLPQLPEVDEITLDLAVGVAEKIGRVVVVAHHVDRARRGCGRNAIRRQGAAGQAGQQPGDEPDNDPADGGDGHFFLVG